MDITTDNPYIYSALLVITGIAIGVALTFYFMSRKSKISGQMHFEEISSVNPELKKIFLDNMQLFSVLENIFKESPENFLIAHDTTTSFWNLAEKLKTVHQDSTEYLRSDNFNSIIKKAGEFKTNKLIIYLGYRELHSNFQYYYNQLEELKNSGIFSHIFVLTSTYADENKYKTILKLQENGIIEAYYEDTY